MKYKFLDVVRLNTNKFNDQGLRKGMVGAVMEVYTNPEGYEVDFALPENNGSSICTGFCEKYLDYIPKDKWEEAYRTAHLDVERYKHDVD
ncbi:DUF4926 domain-containing protein [Eubacteriales bacterium OttesenSCG-928-M02]|nr:DUF4926 domain-containing protein [Eubacteriales bacterium OttesenSCG-928-M02]